MPDTPTNFRAPSDYLPAALNKALNALPGVETVFDNAVIAVSRDKETGDFRGEYKRPKDPLRVWFSVSPDMLGTMLPFLAETVATNYAGHPFRLLVDDTGDGAALGPKGMLVLCYESNEALVSKILPAQVEKLARDITRWWEEMKPAPLPDARTERAVAEERAAVVAFLHQKAEAWGTGGSISYAADLIESGEHTQKGDA